MPKRFSLKIRDKLLLASVPALLLITGTLAFMAYRVSAAAMEEELGQRLITAAGAAAATPGIEYALELKPGDEGTRTYANTLAKLEALRKATSTRGIFLFDKNGRALAAAGVPYRMGERIHRLDLDAAEIASVSVGGTASSVMFEGPDGEQYKTGYAPVRDPGTGEVRAVVGADGSPASFSLLYSMRTRFLLISLVGAALLAAAMIVVSRLITRPVSDLALAARRIAQGDIKTGIAVKGGDEVGLLGSTMEEMRSEIEGRDRHMQMMLSGVAHEIRNPLGGMKLYAGLLREDLAGDAGNLEKLSRIEGELDHLGNVVNSFLEYSRGAAPEIGEFDPGRTLEDARWSVAHEAEQLGVSLRFECGADRIRCDPGAFKRAVTNLVKNAVEASPRGGVVTVSLTSAKDGFTLIVSDTGCGIEPDKLPEVFRPFYTTKERGTGLGLAFVNKFADEHGGRIEVESEPGKGTKFTMKIPPAG